jgi:hypothetical protein
MTKNEEPLTAQMMSSLSCLSDRQGGQSKQWAVGGEREMGVTLKLSVGVLQAVRHLCASTYVCVYPYVHGCI